MFHHLNAPFKKGGSHGKGQDCGKQNHHARGDVDVEVKFSVQQVAGSDQDCADGEVDEDGDQGAVVGFYGGGFVSQFNFGNARSKGAVHSLRTG